MSEQEKREADHEYQASGGHRLDGTTRKNLIDTYDLESRGGWVFWIDAHNRVTAKIIQSRYDRRDDTEANVWSGHYVAVWTALPEVTDDLKETIPDVERLATIRGVHRAD